MHDTRAGAEPGPDERAYDRLPRLARVTAPLAGPLASLAVGLALIGPEGPGKFLRAFGELFHGALAPTTAGASFVRTYFEQLEQFGIVHAFGVLLLKLAAVNLLPLPLLGGGSALIELIRPSESSAAEEKLLTWLQQIGLCLMLLLMVPWWIAIGYVFFEGFA